ncbi:hypothetical protein [Microterricola viridarii]|uniref:Alternate signal-mediated exported protein, RER_14450 family n=1 Tax=Microterricola viridarii TaxID=412690 RepID=A0A0Y0NJ50_9MICO|nr:hypothetical protein [Microterricola viridarii]AMB59785.1 hypothetical protein AWU67_13980 [Microterricola viridarii]
MKHTLPLALAAGLAAVLLLGAQGSMAYLTDAAAGPATVIQSGNLSMTVSAPTAVANEVYGTVPAGMVVRTSGANNTPGIIPGIQRQSYTYTVTNTGSARATARLSASLAFSALTEPRYSALRTALQVSVSIDAAPEVVVVAAGSMPTAAGAIAVPAQTLVFAPGVAHTVTVRFSIPATSGTPFATVGGRSAATSAATLFTLTPTFTLTQVPVAS